MAVAHLGLGSKQNQDRTGRCLGVLSQILSNYDDSVGVAEASGSHSSLGAKKDQSVILKQLQEVEVFANVPGRKHHSFPTISKNVITCLDKKTYEWMKKHISNLQNKF